MLFYTPFLRKGVLPHKHAAQQGCCSISVAKARPCSSAPDCCCHNRLGETMRNALFQYSNQGAVSFFSLYMPLRIGKFLWLRSQLSYCQRTPTGIRVSSGAGSRSWSTTALLKAAIQPLSLSKRNQTVLGVNYRQLSKLSLLSVSIESVLSPILKRTKWTFQPPLALKGGKRNVLRVGFDFKTIAQRKQVSPSKSQAEATTSATGIGSNS